MKFVVLLAVSPPYWDDGVREVVGPFDSEEQAETWAQALPIGSEGENQMWVVAALRSPGEPSRVIQQHGAHLV